MAKTRGVARFFAELTETGFLPQLVAEANASSVAVRVVGGGSNLLVREGSVDALVMKLSGEFESINIQDELVTVGSAAKLSDVISQAAEAGLA